MLSPIKISIIPILLSALLVTNDVIAAHPILVNQDVGNPITSFAWPLFEKMACTLTGSRFPSTCSPRQYMQQDDVELSVGKTVKFGTHHNDDNLDDHEDEDGLHIEEDILNEEQEDGELDELRRHRYNQGWIYLIRHGEKVLEAPDRTGLSNRGIRRSHCLREVFGGKRGDKHSIDFILAQDFKPNGKRKRPFETVLPLARSLDIPLDHSCDRDDEKCAAKKILRYSTESASSSSTSGKNVLVVWEHKRLSDIAEKIGVKGLQYPSERYDVIFKIRNGKVHAIYSEECNGLDEEWFDWHGKKKGKHGKGGQGGRLIDDESWAPDVEEEVRRRPIFK